jgi:hypothetical protein
MSMTRSVRSAMAFVLAASALAWAAEGLDTKLPSPPAGETCADCGVVRSVRRISKEVRPDDAKTDVRASGIVADIPFGGKPKTGPSQRIGKDAVTSTDSWEIIVRLDDGRFRVLTVREAPDVRDGDKVRIEPTGRSRSARPTADTALLRYIGSPLEGQ